MSPAKQQTVKRPVDPAGRLDIALYRLCERLLLPALERQIGLPGISEHLKPYAEAMIADFIPPTKIKPPKPRRRLCI